MSLIQVPDAWKRFISYSFNRVYISPASGCIANCAYCFIFDYGHPRKPQIFEIAGHELRDWLASQPGFRSGKHGTLISLAPSCDPFAAEVENKTLEFIEALAPLQNPIQLSTKYYVDENAAQRLADSQTLPGQILLYGTVTTFRFWKKIEPAALEPKTRLLGLLNARKKGINTCLAVKPVLPGIIEDEVHLFSQAIEDYDIPFCEVGVMYSSRGIEKALRRRKLLTEEFEIRNQQKGTIPPPAHTHDQLLSYVIPTTDIAKKFIDKLKTSGVQCVINGPCAVALSYKILSPTGIWLYRPHLCVKCEANCQERFEDASPETKSIYPKKNPLSP